MFHYASSVPHSFPLPQDVKEVSGETQRMIRGQLLWSSRRAERLMQCKGGALLTFQMELAALRSICSPPLTPRPNSSGSTTKLRFCVTSEVRDPRIHNQAALG